MRLKFTEEDGLAEEDIVEALRVAKTDSRVHTLSFVEIDITPTISSTLVELFQHVARVGRDFEKLSLEFCTGYVDLVLITALATDSIGQLFLALDSPDDELIGRLSAMLRVSASLQSLSLLIPFTTPTASSLSEAIRDNKSLEKISISGSNFDKLDDDDNYYDTDDDDDDDGNDDGDKVNRVNNRTFSSGGGRRARTDSASVSLDMSEFAADFSPAEAASALADGLRENVTLLEVDFSCCYLPDEPLATLVSALVGHPTLQVLNISRNYARRETMDCVGTCIGNEYSKINSLDINEQFSDDSPYDGPLEITPISNALQNNISLESMKLSLDRIDDKQLMHLVDCLQGNETLQELDLQYNMISDEGLEYLTNKLDGIKSLSILLLGGNDIGDKGHHQLEALQEKEPNVCTIERPTPTKTQQQGQKARGKKGTGMLAGLKGLMGGRNDEGGTNKAKKV